MLASRARHRRSSPARAVAVVASLLASTTSRSARADEVVQFPVDGVLDGRPVSTLTAGAIVTWTVGLDQTDGYVTTAVATRLQQTGPALPDDGTFSANATHPRVVLHFSNAAPASQPQARQLKGAGDIVFDVPHATYSKVFLFLVSSYGDSSVTASLTYTDGSTSTTSFVLPDWGTGAPLPASPPIFFNLITGLHKWNQQNQSVDTPTHAITGVTLTPLAGQVLARVRLAQSATKPSLTFWGATGIATGSLDAGVPTSDAGDADADGRASDAAMAADAGGGDGSGGGGDRDEGRDSAAAGGAGTSMTTAGGGTTGAGGGGVDRGRGAGAGCACALDSSSGTPVPWLPLLALALVVSRLGRRQRWP